MLIRVGTNRGDLHRMYITVGRKDIVIGPKGRLAFSTVVVLIMHLLVLWGLVQMRPRIYTFHYSDTEAPLEVELYQVKEPPPEPVPVVKLNPHQIVLPKVEPKPQPQQQAAAPAPAAQPVPAPPSPAPDPAIKARPIEQIDLQQQQVKSFSQTVVANNADMPTLAPAPSLNKVKQRKDEEAGLVKPVTGVTGLSSLNLHAVPDTAPSLEADVAPSGLPAPSGGGKPGGSTAGGGGGAAAGLAGAQGMIGKAMNGRGSLTQAMQNHDYCAEARIKGQTPPPNCKMNALTGQADLGLVNRPDLQKAAAARDANLQYKTGSGNSDYWNRVGGGGSTGVQPNFRPDDQPRKGAYSNPKDQRVMDGVNTDPKSGN